ncbi:helix-turn-helix domain-containing protein [Actinomadura luteofluorescens]|uniref:helix-turn-helix domain-containing protein n=1 Tax=Actinomadura luteofluorescens TaxID=46163 RepID=UPI003644308C
MESHDSLDPRSSLWDLVAVQLRLLRLHHGWTCQQVGEVANASRSHVSNWEAGAGDLTRPTLLRWTRHGGRQDY